MGDWIVRLIEQSGYLGIGFLMFLETLFPPIPSEVIMPVAGVAVGKGKLSLFGTIASGKAADLCVWRVNRPAELCYWIGLPGPERRIFAGLDS